eukprot:15139953-Ditylum_brightwellii.AAC.1
MGSTQKLQQQVCQKYGWSADYGSTEDGHWYVDVTIGLGDKRRYSATEKQAKKKAKETVSAIALQELETDIQHEESKPVKELSQVFSAQLTIFDSSDAATWEMFWKNPPKIVGIDTEGNQTSPPILAQISTDDYTILEVSKHNTISTNLQRLLDDDNIIK